MAGRSARTGRVLIWSGIILLLIGFAPMASMVLASWIAQANGCELNEGMAHACLIGGNDWGHALYTMFVSAWLFLLTMVLIPVGLIVLITGIIVRLKMPRPAADSQAPR